MTAVRLPLLRLPTVYHLGSLDRRRRGSVYGTSQEGAGLSVSLCPHAWTRIARLGGAELNALTCPDALFVDLLAMREPDLALVREWAVGEGLLVRREVWRVWETGEDEDEWRYCVFEDRAEALEEACFSWNAEDEAELAETAGDLPEGAAAVLEPISIHALTEAALARNGGFGRGMDGTEFAVMFFAEDVAARVDPRVRGVWWRESYDPDALSAPRGAVFADRLPEFTRARVALHRVVDEDLLGGMPASTTATIDCVAAAEPECSP